MNKPKDLMSTGRNKRVKGSANSSQYFFPKF